MALSLSKGSRFEKSPPKIQNFKFTSRMAAGLLFPPGPTLFLSKGGEDMTADCIGWRQFAFQELRQGHLAFWDSQLLCGAPFFGDFQSAILSPPNWLFMVFSMPFAVNLGIALHVFLLGWFPYL